MRPTPRETAACRLDGEGPARRLSLSILAGIPGLAHAFTVAGSETPAVVRAISGGPVPVFALRQVHGARVVHVADDGAGPPATPPEGDALCTARRGAALGVQVADCVPILLADPVSGQIAAVHAGWRGTVAGVLAAALDALTARGGRASDVRVAMGPSIGACCFEVGPEVVEALRRSDPGAEACVLSGPRPRVDLIAANRRQALARGVAPGNIVAAGLCTACRADLLESFRRSNGSPGRMSGLIAWRA